MSAAHEILSAVEAQGAVVFGDHGDLVLRPRSKVTEQQIAELRAHKTEILELVELRDWPQASREAVRRFGVLHARLYPFLGHLVVSPAGPARLLQVFGDRVAVVLETDPSRLRFFLPSEVRPPNLVGAPHPTINRTH